MKKNLPFAILILFLFHTSARACITCNKELQADVSASLNFRNLCAVFITILFLTIITMVVSKIVTSRHLKRLRNGNVPFLSPSPVLTAAIVLGIGLGGFIDGIVLHQILQWHEMLSNEIETTTLAGKTINMFWDGLFHIICLIAVCIGLSLLWKALLKTTACHSYKLVWSGLLFGWGIFNSVEGIIDHHLFKIHNVRELAGKQDLYNFSFLIYSFLLLIAGWLLYHSEMKKKNVKTGTA